uniref:C2H2-type domain-containing protein n=1 Tax=Leptobrachium leishanense TaxID=445787 RepID=A0A8C5PYJ3_9ANUR
MDAPEEDSSSTAGCLDAKEQSEVVFVSEHEWGPVKEDGNELYTEVIVEDYHNAPTLECESVEITVGDGLPTSIPSPDFVSNEEISCFQTVGNAILKKPLERQNNARNLGLDSDVQEGNLPNTYIYVCVEDLETNATSPQVKVMSNSCEQMQPINSAVDTPEEQVQVEIVTSHVEEESLYEEVNLESKDLCAPTAYLSIDLVGETLSHEELVICSTHMVGEKDSMDPGIDITTDTAHNEFTRISVKEEPHVSEDEYQTDDSSYTTPEHTQADYMPARVKEEPNSYEEEILSNVAIDAPIQPPEAEYAPVLIKEEPLSCEEECMQTRDECKPRKYIVVANKELMEMTNGKHGEVMDECLLVEQASESIKVANKTLSDPLQDKPHSIQMYSCPECPKCFISSIALSRHQSTHRENRHTCTVCGKQVSTKSSLVRHYKSHTGLELFTCSDCGKLFTYRANLVAHQKTHTGQKPYPCPECGKSFTVKTSLVRHRLIHTGLKPYFCAECGKCFTLNSSLLSHQRRHTGEKPYSCSECDKCFTQISHLLSHQKTHTGEKPFPCPDCGKCFSLNSHLLRHQASHTQEKLFSCSDCGKSFSSGSRLEQHHRIHTGEKPFSCVDCGKCFVHKSSLKKHNLIHTDKEPVMEGS